MFNNVDCQTNIDIRLFSLIIEHIVKAEYEIFGPAHPNPSNSQHIRGRH
jgi:hypothetical protein